MKMLALVAVSVLATATLGAAPASADWHHRHHHHMKRCTTTWHHHHRVRHCW